MSAFQFIRGQADALCSTCTDRLTAVPHVYPQLHEYGTCMAAAESFRRARLASTLPSV